MKKHILLSLLILFVSSVFGNNIKEYLGKGSFYIEGKVTNMPKLEGSRLIQILVSGYIEQNLVDIPIDKDGIFSAKIPIEDIQDISFALKGTYIDFFAYKNDTIRIEFNNDKPLETITLRGTTEERDNDLSLCLMLSKHKT